MEILVIYTVWRQEVGSLNARTVYQKMSVRKRKVKDMDGNWYMTDIEGELRAQCGV
jgi:hypothetical protein